MNDQLPGPIISSIAEHPWVEVKAQLHDGVRRSVWEKFLEWSPDRLVIYARYDPGVVLDRIDVVMDGAPHYYGMPPTD